MKDCCKDRDMRKLENVTVILRKGKLGSAVSFRGADLWFMEPTNADTTRCEHVLYCASCSTVHRAE